MKTQLMKAMKTSISEVLETMFFLPVEFGQTAALSRAGLDAQDTIACRLAFSGDISGHMILAAPEILVLEMVQCPVTSDPGIAGKRVSPGGV